MFGPHTAGQAHEAEGRLVVPADGKDEKPKADQTEMNFEGFTVVDFPAANRTVPGFVYVFCWVGGSGEVPFYVGQTTRIWGRLDDYYWVMFTACTDFRVGEAVRHLNAKGHRIVVKYRSSADPRGEESEIIGSLRGRGRRLLNDLDGYDYRKADERQERLRVQEFVETRLLT